ATFSTDEGLYEFLGLSPGRYQIAVDPDIRFETGVFGQRRADGGGEIITVAAGALTDHIDVSMRPGSVISGRIRDEYGDPIEKVTVRADAVRWQAGRYRFAPGGIALRQTDDLGRFRIFGVPPGRYLVSAGTSSAVPGFGISSAVPGWETNDLPGYVQTYFSGTPFAREAQLVEVVDGRDALNVEFTLGHGRTARISGRVLKANGQPFDGNVHVIA